MDRKQKREHRLRVLDQISAVQDTFCKVCPERVIMWREFNESVAAHTCINYCRKGKEITALGKELDPTFTDGLKTNAKPHIGTKRKYTDADKKKAKDTFKKLTKAFPDISGERLAEEIGIPIGTLYSWKKLWVKGKRGPKRTTKKAIKK